MNCPICNKPIQPKEYIVKCTKCHKIYHSSCWVRNSGCGTPNCDGAPSKQFKSNSQEQLNDFKNINNNTRFNPKNIKINKCPICNKIILNGQDTEKCNYCGTLYHKDCYIKSGGCILKCQENNLPVIQTQSDKNCPYCMMPILPNEEEIICPKCNIPHHKDCWEENGGCTTYGCDCTNNTEDIQTTSNLSQMIGEVTGTRICPYCQSEIGPNERVIYCESCGIPHHESCWHENGGCTTYGCGGSNGSQNNVGGNVPPVINNQNNYPPPPKKSCAENCFNGCVVLIIIWLIMFIFGIGGCSIL